MIHRLPNILTIFRIVITPLIVWFLIGFDGFTLHLMAFVLFIIASLTDLFDGMLARKLQVVSEFGKFMDPLADKIVIFGVLFFAKPVYNAIPGWFIAFIVIREILVFGLGYFVSKDSKREMQANRTGKWSIFLTSITFILMIFDLYPWADYLLYATVVTGSVSLLLYLKFYYYLYQVDVKKPS